MEKIKPLSGTTSNAVMYTDTLKKNGNFLKATGAFKKYRIDYQGLSMEDM